MRGMKLSLAVLAVAAWTGVGIARGQMDAQLGAPAPLPMAGASGPHGIVAITKPSQSVTLSFAKPGLVAKVLVHKGDQVAAGQVVAQEDDTEEQAAYDVAEGEAEDTTRVQAQEAIRDEKQKAYQRKLQSGVANQTELDEAELDFEVGKANVALSKFEQTQSVRKAKQALAALEKTKLRAPISGVVEDTMIHEGETADASNAKVMKVVNIDPLWVDVPVPFQTARGLRKDDAAKVTFSDGTVREGKVINVHEVADPGSNTLTVTVEVANSQRTPAGEQVQVAFPGAKVAARE
ncbi:MAG TPA: efflux RND transporter periplasmic adaptor subunit [Phycisphaerae bacterium]|nr:efflux RND transporter periplasmic adaptor subunit [Phycisphaerae bacterium]